MEFNKRKSLKETLMIRDGMSESQAEQEIEECKADLHARLEEGEMPFNICEEFWGLEPDYLDDIM